MKKTFTKDDLKSGYVVVFKNSERRLVMRAGNFTKILVNPMTGAWNYLSHWNTELKCTYKSNLNNGEARFEHGSDIIEVYGLVSAPYYYNAACRIDIGARKMLWKRVEPRRMTWDQIEEALGYPVEVIDFED